MATLPFMVAKAAKEQGHDVVLWLWNEAVILAKIGVANHVIAVNLPPLKDLLAVIQSAGVQIWVCSACATGRQIVSADLVEGAVIKGTSDYMSAILERDKCITF